MSNATLLPRTGSVTYTRQESYDLLEYAKANRDEGIFNDVTIEAGHLSIGANRMVLSCCSTFFEKMFKSKMKERYEHSITIKQIDATAVKCLVDYMYEGNITIDNTNVMDILDAANFLQLAEVKRFCFKYLEAHISLDSWYAVYSAAKMFGSDELLKLASRFILDHLDAVVQSTDFKTLTKDDFISLISNSRQSEKAIDETALCKLVIDWTKQDEEERKASFTDLFQMINLGRIPYEMLQNLLTETLIKDNVLCAKVVMSELFNLLEEKRKKYSEIKKEMESSKIICVGGRQTINKVIELFNVFNTPKQNYPDLPYNPKDHCALKLNDAIFCIGGYANKFTNQVYQMQMNELKLKWKEVAPMNEERSSMGAAVFNGCMVVAGGWNNSLIAKTEYCNDPSDKWRTGPTLNEARCGNVLVTCGDSLFTIGGRSKCTLSSVERLRSLDGEWQNVAPMITPRYGFAAVSLNGYVYAIGGRSKVFFLESTQNTVERFDLRSNEWSYVCPMKHKRGYHSACVFQGKIFVIGGKDDHGNVVQEIEVYDPQKNEWIVSGFSKDVKYLFYAAMAISI